MARYPGDIYERTYMRMYIFALFLYSCASVSAFGCCQDNTLG